jgi:hypothetical protein
MSTVLDVILRAQVQGLDDFTKNLRTAAEKSFDLDYSLLERGFQKTTDQFSKMMKQAVDLDIKFDTSSLRTLRRDYTSQMGAAAKEVAELEKKLKRQNLTDIQKQEAQAAVQTQKAAMKEAQKRFDAEIKTQSRVLDMASEHVKLVKSGYADATTELSDGFSSAVGDLSSALTSGDLGGLLKGLGKSAKGMGGKMEGKAAAAGPNAGGMTKMLGGIGKLMGKLGPALMMVGAIAGAFFAVAKMIMDADSKVKEFNKELVESVGGASLMAGKFGEVGDAMKSVRGFARGLKSQWSLKAMDKELVGIIGGFDEAGHTMREMTGDLEDMTRTASDFSHSMETALTYSRLLGVDSKTMATDMGTYMEELGLTIDGVAERFSAVTRAASESGFGVKRFYSMVLQATSGMSMYNVRLEEASGLLIRIGKILGSKVGGDFMSKLGKGFVDESMVDRYKRVMLTGTKRMKGIFMRSAEDTALDFTSKLGAKLKGNKELQGVLTDAMSDVKGAKGAVDTLASGKALGKEDRAVLIKSLGSMSDKQQAIMLAKIRGQDADLARELDKLVDVSRGATGSQGDLVKHLDSLDMGGKLNALMNSAKGMFGKELYELSAKQLAAVESATGMSGEALKEMMQISKGLDGQWAMLKSLDNTLVSQTDGEGKVTKIAQAYAGMSADAIAKAQFDQVKATGAYMERTGQIVAGKLDEAGNVVGGGDLNDKGDYVQSSGDVMAGTMGEMVSEDIALAREIADNTWATSNAIEMGVTWFLERIYDVCSAIARFINPTQSKEEKKAKAEASENLDHIAKELQGDRQQIKLQMREKQKELQKTKDPVEQDRIKQELKVMDSEMEKKNFQSAVASRANKETRKDTDSGNWGLFGMMGSDRDAKSFSDKAYGKIKADKTGGFEAIAQKTMPNTMADVEKKASSAVTYYATDALDALTEAAHIIKSERKYTNEMRAVAHGLGNFSSKDIDKQEREWQADMQLSPAETAEAIVRANEKLRENHSGAEYDKRKITATGGWEETEFTQATQYTSSETNRKQGKGLFKAGGVDIEGGGLLTMPNTFGGRQDETDSKGGEDHFQRFKPRMDLSKMDDQGATVLASETEKATDKALKEALSGLEGKTDGLTEKLEEIKQQESVDISKRIADEAKRVKRDKAIEKLNKNQYPVAYAEELVKQQKKQKALDLARAAGLTGRRAEVAAQSLASGKAPANVVSGLSATRDVTGTDGVVRKERISKGMGAIADFPKLDKELRAKDKVKDFLYTSGEGLTRIPEHTKLLGVDPRDGIKSDVDDQGRTTLMGSYPGSPLDRAGGKLRDVGAGKIAGGGNAGPSGVAAGGTTNINVRNDTDARRLVDLIKTTVSAMNGGSGGAGWRKGGK